MKSNLRNVSLNIYELDKLKAYYKNLFITLEYITLEEDTNHIKFRSLNDDFTLLNFPSPINSNAIHSFEIWLSSKNDLNGFYKNFISEQSIKISNTSSFNTDIDGERNIIFTDPSNIEWKIFHDTKNDDIVIKEQLKKNFLKEYVYCILLFPYGFIYAYRFIFKFNHKIVGIFCLLITLSVLAFYLYSVQQLASGINIALNTSLSPADLHSLGY